MNVNYELDVNADVLRILKKSISSDLRAVQTAVKILLLKNLPDQGTEESEQVIESNE